MASVPDREPRLNDIAVFLMPVAKVDGEYLFPVKTGGGAGTQVC
jgi:hypothetical protein